MSCVLPEDITSIGRYAFWECTSLGEELVIPNKVDTIGYGAFQGCSRLEDVTFSARLKRIEGHAFYNSGIAFLKLPTSLESIGSSAFASCDNLHTVRIPSSVRTVEDWAFGYNDAIKDVYTYTIDPLAIGQSTFSTAAFGAATLHVPETAYDNYYYNTQWSQFPRVVQFKEPYEYFYLNNDLTMDEDTPRLEGKTDEGTGDTIAPDADFNAGSGLVVEGDEEQNLGDVHIKDDGKGNGGSVIGGNGEHGNVHADRLHIDIEVQANRWYFFSFPFRIDKKNVKYDGSYVWRHYDGEYRAEHGNGGWKDLDDTHTHLERGKGYIFQGDKTGTLTLIVENARFDGNGHNTHLDNHHASNAHNAGWNFVGNPHTSYFDVADMGYKSPITIWDANKQTYVAIRPGDDEHVLHPYQAFFVQKPDGTAQITFAPQHRQTKRQSESEQRAEARSVRSAAHRMANAHRQLVNLTIGANDSIVDDRTRVVFNEASRMEYETACDAAKFMATGVAQIYTIDERNVKYAINERPTDSGRVTLAYVAPTAGTYTINVARADAGVVLKDRLTGASHDFSKGGYTFTSEAGTYEGRFMLVKDDNVTGIDGVFATDGAVVDVQNGNITLNGAGGQTLTVTSMNGTVVATLQGNGTVNVQPGVYVISVGKHTRKIMVK